MKGWRIQVDGRWAVLFDEDIAKSTVVDAVRMGKTVSFEVVEMDIDAEDARVHIALGPADVDAAAEWTIDARMAERGEGQ